MSKDLDEPRQLDDLSIERTYTFEDMRLVSMYARLEGAPATVEEIIRDLDAKGKLSPSTTTQGAVDLLREAHALLPHGAYAGWRHHERDALVERITALLRHTGGQ